MPEPAESAAGSIYDLGYRHYGGTRLGRRHAVLSLYVQSLRGVFGFGRHTSSKIIPIGLTIVALLPARHPARLYLASPKTPSPASDIFQPSDYYEFIQWPLALFVAAVGPELVGRDQRNRTLVAVLLAGASTQRLRAREGRVAGDGADHHLACAAASCVRRKRPRR